MQNTIKKLENFEGEQFKRIFRNYFKEKLGEYHSAENENIYYGFNKAELCAELGIAVATVFIPVAGPFLAVSFVSLKIGMTIYESYIHDKEKQQNDFYYNYVDVLNENQIDVVISNTAHEVARAFEYQIYMLKTPNDLQKFAKFAVKKILECSIDHYKNNEKVIFHQNNLLEALISEYTPSIVKQAKDTITVHQNLLTKGNFTWKVYEIFSKVGLREEIEFGQYKYAFKADSKQEDMVYGYRAKIPSLSQNLTYINSKLDDGYTKTFLTNFEDEYAKSYVPLMRLAFQEEIDHYCNHFIELGKINVSFNEFFRAYNNYPQEEIILVFRDIGLTQNCANNGDFTNVDMLGVLPV